MNIKKFKSISILLVVFIAACGYVYNLSDIFVSESKFVVRGAGKPSGAGLGALIKNIGFSKSIEDTQVLKEYLESRDVLMKVEESLNLKNEFSRKNHDYFNRFSTMISGYSFEEFYQYSNKIIEVGVDDLGGVVTVRTSAFSPEVSLAINKKIVELSEGFIEKINEKARMDSIKFAKEDLFIAKKNDLESAQLVSDFANENNVISIDKQATIDLQRLSKLNAKITEVSVEMKGLQGVAENSSRYKFLVNRKKDMTAAVDSLSKSIAGDRGSLAGKYKRYSLLLEKKKATGKIMLSALASLEQAKSEARKKQLYLEVIASPSKPDFAMEPKRVKLMLSIVVLLILSFSAIKMLLSGVREHVD